MGQGKGQIAVALEPFSVDAKMKQHRQLGVGQPTFSVSGELVTMVSVDKTGTAYLRVVNADGTAHTKIPPINVTTRGKNARGCYDPAFSPDERYLAYVRSDLQPLSDIHLHDLRTGASTPLTTDHADNQSPAFSPDGRSIAFVAARKGQSHGIFLMSLR